ncbi:MAG: hypothetical protein Q7S82_03600 [bacterium]|nr:hypothetical protein [bacterium]
MRKVIILLFFLYILVLVQAGFFAHFPIFGFFPNFIFIFVIIINIFEKPKDKLGLCAGFLGGFFLDIFSLSNNLFFGFYTLISLFLVICIKFILMRYVQLPTESR